MSTDAWSACESQEPQETCFKILERVETNFVERFHEHVPGHRMSEESRIAALRGLIAHFSKTGPEAVLWSFANTLGGGSRKYVHGLFYTEYLGGGRLRQGIGGDVQGWFDRVIGKPDHQEGAEA